MNKTRKIKVVFLSIVILPKLLANLSSIIGALYGLLLAATHPGWTALHSAEQPQVVISRQGP